MTTGNGTSKGGCDTTGVGGAPSATSGSTDGSGTTTNNC